MMRRIPALTLLLVACVTFAAGVLPAAAAPAPCEEICYKDYNAEVEDCLNKADVTGILKPLSLTAAPISYTGPQVDVAGAVREQCKQNIGTGKLNACLDACKPPPPPSCEDACKAKWDPQTVGRLRCIYNCNRRHLFF